MNTSSKDKSNEYLRTKDLLVNDDNENEAEDEMNENFDLNLNLNTLNEEYDNYIHELHRKLQIAKEERKRSEMEAKLLQHRVVLLHNQEKLAIQKFERTRNKLEQIIENRKFISQENKVSEHVREEKRKNLIKLRETVKSRKENLRTSSQSNLRKNPLSRSKDLRILQQIRDSSKAAESKRENMTMRGKQVDMVRKQNESLLKKQEEERKREILDKKLKLKEELLKKIQEEEMERTNLENQLAKVEKEEMKIMKLFKEGDQEEPVINSFERVYNNSRKKQNMPPEEIIGGFSNNNTSEIHFNR